MTHGRINICIPQKQKLYSPVIRYQHKARSQNGKVSTLSMRLSHNLVFNQKRESNPSTETHVITLNIIIDVIILLMNYHWISIKDMIMTKMNPTSKSTFFQFSVSSFAEAASHPTQAMSVTQLGTHNSVAFQNFPIGLQRLPCLYSQLFLHYVH